MGLKCRIVLLGRNDDGSEPGIVPEDDETDFQSFGGAEYLANLDQAELVQFIDFLDNNIQRIQSAMASGQTTGFITVYPFGVVQY
jgi:hypothetical protein